MKARIGDYLDLIKDVDEIDERKTLDNTINNHGKELINFLLETKFGVVNGWLNPSGDNFTSVTNRNIPDKIHSHSLYGYAQNLKRTFCKIIKIIV